MQLPAACNMLLISYIVKPTFSVFINSRIKVRVWGTFANF